MKLSKKQIVLAVAALLAVIGFFMMFAGQIKALGETLKFKDVFFGGNGIKGAWPVFIAYLLVLFAGVVLCLAAFLIKDEKRAKMMVLAAAGILVIAAILIFLVKTIWCGMNSVPSAYKKYYDLGVGSILAGIFALLAAAGAVVAELVLKD